MDPKVLAAAVLVLAVLAAVFFLANPFKGGEQNASAPAAQAPAETNASAAANPAPARPVLACDPNRPEADLCQKEMKARLGDCSDSVLTFTSGAGYTFWIDVQNKSPDCQIAVNFSIDEKNRKNVQMPGVDGTSMTCMIPMSQPAQTRISVAAASDRNEVFEYCTGSFVEFVKADGQKAG